MQEVVRVEVFKLLQANIIYPISNSPWVSPTQVVPKKSGITVVQNDKGEDVSTRVTTSWRVCIDYRRLNAVTRNDHFSLPFIDQVLERVFGHPFYCFLDGYSGYFQIQIDVEDQDKTTFTCTFDTYAYRRMSFDLCNAPATFQRCMLSIFSDMVERITEVFMDDITIYESAFDECLLNLEVFLNRCIEKDLVFNWEKCHFMVQQGIVLGHIISKQGIEVDKAKLFDHQSNPRLRRVLWNPWQKMSGQAYPEFCFVDIPPGCLTSGILLRRHSTRMSHIRNSSPPPFHPDILHPALDAGWERRAFQLPRSDISGSSDSAYPKSFAAILHSVAVFS
ncbi:Retrovirus-related Pol polyprotein from transposon 17.6 [Vitis vinifera]|uniref:Retrovirus-related Pol polyprotein from transposon 17.6 n=1 Tax=Vitis vinifera TaxID=29760 RepID=A0A438GLY2_VITVI|nr:Retrovirus-related Pol polyprotein from transposon 17.6 [Vitis vinifera]